MAKMCLTSTAIYLIYLAFQQVLKGIEKYILLA